jgi:hypothetical protein
MDHTVEHSRRVSLQLDESRPNNGTNTSETIDVVSDHTAIRQPHSDPVPSTLGCHVDVLTDERPGAIGESAAPSPCHCHCPCFLAHQTKGAKSDSHNVITSRETYPFEKHGMDTDRTFLEMGDISDVSSQGPEHSEKLDPIPDLVLPKDGDENVLAIDEQTEVSVVSKL